MSTVIESLLMEIGVKADNKSLKKINKVTEVVGKTLKRVAVAAGAAGAAIVAYTVSAARYTDANAKFAKQTGVSYDALQELGFAAKREGSSLDSLKSSLAGLTKAAGEASMGTGAGIEAFARLGINIRDANGEIKNADSLLGEVSTRFQGLTTAEQTDLIGKLGISQDMLLLLQKGTENMQMLRAQARRYGIESRRMSKSGQLFQDNIVNLKASITGLLLPLRQFTLDLANNLIPRVSEWIANNRILIKQKFAEYLTKIIVEIKEIGKSLKKAIPFIEAAVAAFIAFKAIKAGIFIYEVGMAIWSLVPAIAAATGGLSLIVPAIAAIVAGLGVWMAKSKLGREVLEYTTKRIRAAFKDLETAVVEVFNKLGLSVENFSDIWEKYLKPALEWLAAGAVVTAVEGIVAVVKLAAWQFKLWGVVIDSVKDSIKEITKEFEQLKKGPKGILKFLVGYKDKEKLNIVDFKEFIRGGNTPAPAPAGANNVNTSSSTNNVNAKIEVSSASGDPIAIGNAVKDAIESIARNGIENQTVAVLA